MFGNLGGWHLIVILFIILLLFGAPKLPGLAKSLGQSMRILKKEVRPENEAEAAPAEAAAPAPVDPQEEAAKARAEAEAAKRELEELKARNAARQATERADSEPEAKA